MHSDKGIETHRSAIGESLITPNRNIYIRNNMPTMTDEQIGNRMDWKVSIEGVKNPKTFTIAQLQKLGHQTMATILQCSGNGRGFLNISQEVRNGKQVQRHVYYGLVFQ